MSSDGRLERWLRAKRVLCVRLDNVGDLLMTTPALRALRCAAPGRRLTLLASSAGAEAAPWIPEVDDMVAYDAPWMKACPSRREQGADARMIDSLSRRRFDTAVIFTVYSQSPLPAALLCALSGIPLRLAHCRENPYQLLTDWLPDPEPKEDVRHEVRRQLDLVESVGCPAAGEGLSFRVPEEVLSGVRRYLAGSLDMSRPWAVVHPGASAPSRRYPPELFAAAADILAREHGWQILFTGSRDERALVDGIRSMMSTRTLSLAGRLGLAELAAAISLAPVLIVNNTGPAHLAAAVGTPVADLYALTNPQHAPWGVPHRMLFHDVPCKFCYKSVCPERHHACLRLVEPRAVAEAALALAGAGSSPGEGMRLPAPAAEESALALSPGGVLADG